MDTNSNRRRTSRFEIVLFFKCLPERFTETLFETRPVQRDRDPTVRNKKSHVSGRFLLSCGREEGLDMKLVGQFTNMK